ncbi:PREDICTED: NADH dehydrogenase [ubiquinone] 1 alpha subcomplex subunit 8 [Nicrophorus vespilloides]|uniref:NADH dehydrogenase [ubiquinone] 1 alpha subcomplex subunit 8 n=1 Tax=Nicrophorus vespilloides TaxID=110193 RepID=A0ABM1M4S7_NICVS|nr:PREDICTED: NADH dehydrogenase [ubiquinone] 1 alpha subcomplex subunit 8 [Nicrophorus vespilloides]
MSITANEYMPTQEELTVKEIEVSGPVLKAGAMHLGKRCEYQNNEFVLCRNETGDPRACIKEGKEVTNCAMNFFKDIKKSCYGEFMQYVNCLDKSSTNQAFSPCRKTQGVFDKCMQDNLNMERPPHDYFARTHIHKTNRPKPVPEPKPEYPDRNPYLPEDAELPPAKYGSRYIWMW